MKTFILLLLVLVIGGFVFVNRRAMLPLGAPTTGGTPSVSTSTAPASNAATTVNLTSDGFVPQSLTVSPGTRVTWVNQTSSTATINSDDHPTHLKWPFLNLGQFTSGGSLSVVFPATPGTYTYHDHFHPQFKGTVIVK